MSDKPPIYLEKVLSQKLRIYAYRQLPLFLPFSLFCLVTVGKVHCTGFNLSETAVGVDRPTYQNHIRWKFS